MKIFYTGIGCNPNSFHIKDEFIDIMNREFTYNNWNYELSIIPKKEHYQLQFKDFNLPNDFFKFTFNDWIEYSGAEVIII